MRWEEPVDDDGMITITQEEFEAMAVGTMKFWLAVASVAWLIILLVVIIVMLVVL